MRTKYFCYLANIIDIQWSRPAGGGGGANLNSQLNWLTCCKRQNVVTLRLQRNMVRSNRGNRWTTYTIANSISLLR